MVAMNWRVAGSGSRRSWLYGWGLGSRVPTGQYILCRYAPPKNDIPVIGYKSWYLTKRRHLGGVDHGIDPEQKFHVIAVAAAPGYVRLRRSSCTKVSSH